MRYIPFLLLLAACQPYCVGGCLTDAQVQDLLDTCARTGTCFNAGASYQAPAGQVEYPPIIQPPTTILVVPDGGIYGY
jgi:hypothetical protein